MLEVQKYLKSHSLDELCMNFSIKATCDSSFVILNYDQFASKKDNPIVMECRGLILKNGSWDVKLFPMRRFFNYGEISDHASCDLTKFSIQQKVDGSMLSLWFDDIKNCWQTATRSCMYGDNQVSNLFPDMTFRNLFEQAFDFSKLNGINPNQTFTFELCSPYNRVVTHFDTPQAFLITTRYNETGKIEESVPEVADHFARLFNVARPAVYTFNSVQDAFDIVKTLHQEEEGYVFFYYGENGYERFKLKNPAYVALHHIRSGASLKNFVKLICGSGELDEFIQYFPEYEKPARQIDERFKMFLRDQELEYTKLIRQQLLTRKERALFIQSQGNIYTGWLYRVIGGYRDYVTAKEHFTDLAKKRPEKLIDILNLKTLMIEGLSANQYDKS